MSQCYLHHFHPKKTCGSGDKGFLADLSNYWVYKILTKVLAIRLDKVVPEPQNAFVKE